MVKAFNNIYFGHLLELARPSGSEDRSALAIAGDDEGAKKAVVDFLDDIGYDTVDAGPLAEGWRYQRDTAAYGTPYTEGWGTADMKPRTGDADRVRSCSGRPGAIPRHGGLKPTRMRTWSGNAADAEEPAHIQPSPIRAARRSAGGVPAPNHTGGPGR